MKTGFRRNMTHTMQVRVSLAVAVALLLSSCGGRTGPASRHTVAMNTYVTVTVYDEPEGVDALLDSAVREIARVEQLASDYSDTTEIGRVNAAAGRGRVPVSPELAALVGRGLTVGREHASAFNIAVGPLVHRWDFLAEPPKVPRPATVDSLLRLTDLSRVNLDSGGVRLELPGMRLDLGGIAKGYAVDRAMEVLRRGGVRRALVDIGGNLGVLWEGTSALDSVAATIRVRHPRREGEFLGSFPVGTAGVSTSGDYQRFFMSEGVRYHHILDPSTGYPARGVVAVTVVAPDAETADIASTLAFVLGPERGMQMLRATPGLDGLFVLEEGNSLVLRLSPGMAARFVREDARD